MLVDFYCPDCYEMGEEHIVPDCYVEFEREAVPCSDPDHPEFSNPPSGSSVEAPEQCDRCGMVIDHEAVYGQALEQCEADREAAYEMRCARWSRSRWSW